MPPWQHDELISSWLARVARFYGMPVYGFLADNGIDPATMDFGALDIGSEDAVLAPVACLLDITAARLANRTIIAAFLGPPDLWPGRLPSPPWGRDRPCGQRYALNAWMSRGRNWVSRGFAGLGRWRGRRCAPVTASACWTRRGPGPPGVAGLLWSSPQVQQMTCACALDRLAPAISDQPCGTTLVGPIERELLRIQDSLASGASCGGAAIPGSDSKQAAMVSDVVWALMRPDRAFPERTTYEAFALEELDSEWHIARRRSAVPADYTLFGVHVRHAVMAAATVVAGGRRFRSKLCFPRNEADNELAFLLIILVEADAAALVARSVAWPEPARAALMPSGLACT